MDDQIAQTDVDQTVKVARYEAVYYLLQNGRRNSEWAESSLLLQVSKVMSGKATDLSKENLDAMIEDAAAS